MQRLAAEFLSADYLFLAVGVVGGACSDVAQSFFEVAQFAKREKLVSILQGPDSIDNFSLSFSLKNGLRFNFDSV